MTQARTGSEAVAERDLVLVALQQAGISPDPDEIDALVTAYPVVQAATAALYAIPTARDEAPATTFAPRQGRA